MMSSCKPPASCFHISSTADWPRRDVFAIQDCLSSKFSNKEGVHAFRLRCYQPLDFVIGGCLSSDDAIARFEKLGWLLVRHNPCLGVQICKEIPSGVWTTSLESSHERLF